MCPGVIVSWRRVSSGLKQRRSRAIQAIVALSIAAAGCSNFDGSKGGEVAKATLPATLTQSGDELRTGWYADQPGLSPSVVAGSNFGKIFSTPITGQVYAQPLVSQGTLFVATEANWIYGLDPISGAVRWSRSLGTPFSAFDIQCNDLVPDIGITGTPAIDSATNTAYFFAKKYITGNTGPVGAYAHAVDVATGAERPGFPVLISGNASNNPSSTFSARTESQRPGILLLDGVVYAGFGSHCDVQPFSGWIVGVSTSGVIKTLWTTRGGGIWQSGSGLVSDGPGQILFATGNTGAVAGPIPGTSPPATLGQSIVRLGVQADGTLRATDFFSPYDAVALDGWDADLASAGPVGLPSQYFGTAQYPNLLAVTGKQGYVYLLNRDSLGGIGNGPGGGDAVISRIGPFGGVWSKPAVWPGDGGYI
jgi:hypothetical protein